MNASEYVDSEGCQENCYVLLFKKVHLCGTKDILGSLSQLMANSQDSGSLSRVTRRKLLPDVRYRTFP